VRAIREHVTINQGDAVRSFTHVDEIPVVTHLAEDLRRLLMSGDGLVDAMYLS
jgi:hypothetical protein